MRRLIPSLVSHSHGENSTLPFCVLSPAQFLKAGFAADNLPRYNFQSIVGRPTLRAEEDILGDVELKVRDTWSRSLGSARVPSTPLSPPPTLPQDIMVGDEAAAIRQALEISYPLENGVIRNWDDMEHVWSYLFGPQKMNIADNLGEHRCLLTEAPLNPKENRKKMIEVMMEKYGFGHMQVGIQAMLTLYAQGLLTGLVLDSGDGVTHVVAVYDGFVPQHLTKRLDVAGRHITRYMIKLLLLRGYAFNRTADFQTVAEIKEKLCYVALDPKKERLLAQETTALVEKYTLPDGRIIQVGRERFEAAEALFNPSLVDVESPGMSDLVFDVIQKAETDIRPDLYKAIVLSGGTTMYPGLPSRLEHDIRQRYLNEILKGDKSRVGVSERGWRREEGGSATDGDARRRPAHTRRPTHSSPLLSSSVPLSPFALPLRSA